MDKLKPALDVLKKYHFWFMIGGVLIVALGCWWLASSSLQAKYEERKSTIDNQSRQVLQVVNDSSIPNRETIANIEAQHTKLKEYVLSAWELLYQEQKKNNPIPSVLGEDFKMYFEALRPGEEMAPQFRERYRGFIDRHYLDLLELVDRRHVKGEEDPRDSDSTRNPRQRPRRRTGGAGDYGPMLEGGGGRSEQDQTDEEDVYVGVVEWDAPEIFDIADWDQRPTTQQVLLAQEDLWVYEALLRMIRNVNEGVDSHDKAWIKQIRALEVGRPAAEAWVELQQPIFSAPTAQATAEGQGMGAAGGMAGGGMAGPGMAGPGLSGGQGRMPPSMPQPGGAPMMEGAYGPESGFGGGDAGDGNGDSLLHHRYVDQNGFPITAERAKNQPPYAEFKMMMVRMDLDMHQRHVTDLLVECANSAMPVEVVRVRMNPGADGGGLLDGTGSQRRRNERTPGGGGFGRPRITGGDRGGRDETDFAEDSNSYHNVEVFGIIYIYNRPDREKLGTGTAGIDVPAEQEPPLNSEPSNERIPQPENGQGAPGAGQGSPGGSQPGPATPQAGPGANGAPAQPPGDAAAPPGTSPGTAPGAAGATQPGSPAANGVGGPNQ